MAGRKNFGRISESDFASLLQALSATTKGRSFLKEYSRRARPEETLSLLDSLQRIETTIDGLRSQIRPELIAGELQHIAMTLEIAVDGAEANPEGNETARRFALVERARRELESLAKSLAAELGPEEPAQSDEPLAR